MKLLEIPHWIQNISERKKQIGVSMISTVAGAAILIGYFQSGPDAARLTQAESAIVKWNACPENDELFQGMKEAIRSLPELEKKYESTIAQNLINSDRIDEALSMAIRAIQRVEKDIPYHAHFAKTSLLIEQGYLQEALERSVSLKEEMGGSFLRENKGGSFLYLHNLFRIACLQYELKNGPGEKAALNELEAFLNADTPVSTKLKGGLSEKNLDLTSYIEKRRKEL